MELFPLNISFILIHWTNLLNKKTKKMDKSERKRERKNFMLHNWKVDQRAWKCKRGKEQWWCLTCQSAVNHRCASKEPPHKLLGHLRSEMSRGAAGAHSPYLSCRWLRALGPLGLSGEGCPCLSAHYFFLCRHVPYCWQGSFCLHIHYYYSYCYPS